MKAHHWILGLVCVLTVVVTIGFVREDHHLTRNFWITSLVITAGMFLILDPGVTYAKGSGVALYLLAFVVAPLPLLPVLLCAIHLVPILLIINLRRVGVGGGYANNREDRKNRDRIRATEAGAATKLSGSMESMIDRETGQVRLSPDFRLGPETTRDEFLDSSLAESCKLLEENDAYCSWRVPEQSAGGGGICAALYFEGQVLSRIDLSLGGLEGPALPEDWSRERDFQQKLEHDALLEKWLPGQRSLPWGSVCSTYDDRAASSVILVEYSQETSIEPTDSAEPKEHQDN